MSGCTQVCNQGRDCTCITQQCENAAPEGGNVWFAEPEPVERLAGWEMALVWSFILIMGICSTALIVTGATHLYQLFF